MCICTEGVYCGHTCMYHEDFDDGLVLAAVDEALFEEGGGGGGGGRVGGGEQM